MSAAKRIGWMVSAAVLFAAAFGPLPAAAMSTGITAPFDAKLSYDSTAATFTVAFSWRIECPEDFCLMAKSFEVVRNGSIVASNSSSPFPHDSDGKFAVSIVIPASSWRPGDCFAVRAVAPFDDPSKKRVFYSKLSNSVCAPSG